MGGQILDTNYATMMSMTEFGYAQSPDLLKAWKQAGDITEVPRIYSNGQFYPQQKVINFGINLNF